MMAGVPMQGRVEFEVQEACQFLMEFSRRSPGFLDHREEPQKVLFRWIRSSGCTRLQISTKKSGEFQPFQLAYQVFSRADEDDYRMLPDDELLIFRAIERTMAMHFARGVVVWENHFGYCQGICYRPYILMCREFAGKLLCEDCINSLSLTEPVAHRTNETKIEKTERDKMVPSLRYAVLERYRFTCQSCGRSAPDVKLHVDHKIPISMGGLTILENLHVLCSDCNLGKSDNMPSQETLSFWTYP